MCAYVYSLVYVTGAASFQRYNLVNMSFIYTVSRKKENKMFLVISF